MSDKTVVKVGKSSRKVECYGWQIQFYKYLVGPLLLIRMKMEILLVYVRLELNIGDLHTRPIPRGTLRLWCTSKEDEMKFLQMFKENPEMV